MDRRGSGGDIDKENDLSGTLAVPSPEGNKYRKVIVEAQAGAVTSVPGHVSPRGEGVDAVKRPICCPGLWQGRLD